MKVGVVTAATAALALAGAAAYKRYSLAMARAALAGLASAATYRDAALVIVVDVGSSSIRASCFALVDAASGKGSRGAKSSQETEASHLEWVMLSGSMQQRQMHGIIDANGEADIHRIQATVESVVRGVLEFLRAAHLAQNVCGVGFSSFAMNLVGVDDKGCPVTPVYTYAGRRPATASFARQLRESLEVQGRLEEFHNRTGTVIHPAYAPVEFLRLHHEEPHLVEKVHAWQSISSYLLSKWMLAGEERAMPMSFSEASWTGLLDFRRGVWDESLINLVGMDKRTMPHLQDSALPISGLRPAYANVWPELSNVPFFLGIGDGAAANVGSKCVDDTRIAVTIGTSAAIRVVLNIDSMRDAKVPKGLWCYRIGRELVMLGGALNDGGSVFQYFRESLNFSAADIETHLREARPAQHGLTLLPFLSGERAPGWKEEATCTITGINKWTSAFDFLQAGMEGVALRIAQVYSLLANHAASNAMIVASGTALTSSRAWRQMLADAIGRELALESDSREATSRGVAVFLGTYLGFHSFQDSQQLSGDISFAHPRVEAHATYLVARQEQEQLYRKLYT